jgi:DNA repair protein RadA/Sms
VPIGSVDVDSARATPSGVGELDRVLGGGLVSGAVVLLAGRAGIGKSTLLLEVAAAWARAGERSLYVTGEESASQVRMRADRTDGVHDGLFLAAETDLSAVLTHIEQVQPSLLIVDSVQTIASAQVDGGAGGVTQVREVAATLTQVAKRTGLPIVLVGHVTKDGGIAGPRVLEHMVDVVLSFEGDKQSRLRLVRAVKNRFGPVDEVGCFDLSDTGIVEVLDPTGLFVSRHHEAVPGTCVTVTLEGRRPLLAEVQSLVMATDAPSPKRSATGIDGNRLAMLLAVLGRRCGISLSKHEVYSATVGGARLHDPAADLAIAISLASAGTDQSCFQRLIAIGEIGLAGEVRRVVSVDQRVAEAARLGFTHAIVPFRPGSGRQVASGSVRDHRPRRTGPRVRPTSPGAGAWHAQRRRTRAAALSTSPNCRRCDAGVDLDCARPHSNPGPTRAAPGGDPWHRCPTAVTAPSMRWRCAPPWPTWRPERSCAKASSASCAVVREP